MDLVGLADGCKGGTHRGPCTGDTYCGPGAQPFHLSTPDILFSLSELKAVAHHTECIYEVVISFPMFY